MRKSQIRNFYKIMHISFFVVFYVQFDLEHYMLYFVSRKVCICGLAEVLSPQITKRLGPQIANPQKCHICGRSANLTNDLSPQISGYTICGTYLPTANKQQLDESYLT
jgi:hypothetical protein